MAANKDVIYVDIDDEITAVIDKIQSSKSKIVALVLPKRAPVFQSAVNMKLLKRSAKSNNKNLVLVTSDNNVLPLAGAVGVHIAKTTTSKPVIPKAPEDDNKEDVVSGEELENNVGKTAVAAAAAASTGEESIELDNTSPAPKSSGKTGKKTPKIPNFNRFRNKFFIIGAAGAVLLVFLFLAIFVLPKATVAVKTKTSDVNATVNFTADVAATSVDVQNAILPATKNEVKKNQTASAPATGQKDVGEKATGSVRLRNCSKVDGKVTIPAGTAVSTSGLNYITQSSITLSASSFTGGGTCTSFDTKEVNVIAQSPGTTYNVVKDKSFTVAGFSGVTGKNDDPFSGGSTKMVKVVSQQDVDAAKSKLGEGDKTAANEELKSKFKSSGLVALPDTLSESTPNVQPQPAVGSEAQDVTVTAEVTYSMLGVPENALNDLINQEINKQISNKDQQEIRDNGLANASYKVTESSSPDKQVLAVSVTAVVGPKIDEEAIKKDSAGKKSGEIEDSVGRIDGVDEVVVKYSPFWVSKAPKDTSKITVVVEESGNE